MINLLVFLRKKTDNFIVKATVFTLFSLKQLLCGDLRQTWNIILLVNSTLFRNMLSLYFVITLKFII